MNEQILRNAPVQTKVMGREEALAYGALAFFGDKYGERVRVVEIPGFSKEFCGGTHVRQTGDIGLFLVTAEQGISAGTRRVEALTGEAAITRAREDQGILEELESRRRRTAGPRGRVREDAGGDQGPRRENDQLKMKLATRAGRCGRRYRGGGRRPGVDAPLRGAGPQGPRRRRGRVPEPEPGPAVRPGVGVVVDERA